MKRALCVGVLAACGVGACTGWSPSRPFERDAPPVREAIAALDAGDGAAAANALEDYLSTGPCKDGNIGTPDLVRRRADGTFDLGLSLFRLGEQYGRRFGEEESASNPTAGPHRGGPGDVTEASRAQRHAQIGCAHLLVQSIAADPATPPDLRVRAEYLDGNLSFLDGEYEQAVRAYDQALAIAPGQIDAGDPVARDAAWNRAIALERIEEKKDAGSDASNGDSGGGGDGGQDGGKSSPDGGQDGGGKGDDDAGPDSGDDASPPPPEPRDTPDSGGFDAAPRVPLTNEDERMLDQLESAPTLQQEVAKHSAKRRRVPVDK
jgi:hypothetical protein